MIGASNFMRERSAIFLLTKTGRGGMCDRFGYIAVFSRGRELPPTRRQLIMTSPRGPGRVSKSLISWEDRGGVNKLAARINTRLIKIRCAILLMT